MLPRGHVNPLRISWEHRLTRAIPAPQWRHRLYSTHPPQDVAVVGGGITGLVSAYYLTKRAPNTKITIYESQQRLGGWLRSSYQEVAGGKALFEHGPRTLRSAKADIFTPRLIQDLGLTEEVVCTSKYSPAALYRYIYYPDRLVQMPYPGMDIWEVLWKLLTEPVFKGTLRGAFREFFQPSRADLNGDESVGSFITRRASKDLGDNLVSAVVHGIYAGDIYQLSAKSLFGLQWWAEGEYGSIIRAVAELSSAGVQVLPREDVELLQRIGPQSLDDSRQKLIGASVYSFKKGIEQLVRSLEDNLRSSPNVLFKVGKPVQRLEAVSRSEERKSYYSVDKIRVHTQGDGPPIEHDQVISTIFSGDLASICTPSTASESELSALTQTSAVTVMVVNLYYRESNLIPVRGFGYLIPRSIPFIQNPERALGVIFDSDAMKGQDDAPGTKLTVMLGGHWWDGWTSYPDEEEAIVMARMILSRHLKVSMDVKPEAAKATLQNNCIPQYTVGHFDRMRTAHNQLKRVFDGKLRVAGNSYTGVGVKDCIKSAWQVVDGLVEGRGSTGLERFRDQPRWDRVRPLKVEDTQN